MTKREHCLAVIPARGGSKRLPGKNTMELNGAPLIAWTIRAAIKCDKISKIVVSTDDSEIQKLALQFGAEAPFLRPAALSTDQAGSADVILHALDFYFERGLDFQNVMLLQPTSPLRTVDDIQNAFDLMREKQANSVISVCPCEHHPFWCGIIPPSQSMDAFLDPKLRGLRSQDLPAMHRLNGAIYLRDTLAFREDHSLSPQSGSFALIMPTERSIDIDTHLDFQIAQVLAPKTDSKREF